MIDGRKKKKKKDTLLSKRFVTSILIVTKMKQVWITRHAWQTKKKEEKEERNE